jgi:hypothetical protein
VRRPARESLDRIYENLGTLRDCMATPGRRPDVERGIDSATATMHVLALVAVAEALVEINETLDKSIYPAIAERGS